MFLTYPSCSRKRASEPVLIDSRDVPAPNVQHKTSEPHEKSAAAHPDTRIRHSPGPQALESPKKRQLNSPLDESPRKRRPLVPVESEDTDSADWEPSASGDSTSASASDAPESPEVPDGSKTPNESEDSKTSDSSGSEDSADSDLSEENPFALIVREFEAGKAKKRPSTSPDKRRHDQAPSAKPERVVDKGTSDLQRDPRMKSDRAVSQSPKSTRAPPRAPVDESTGKSRTQHVPKEISDRLVDTYLMREYVNLPIFDLSEFMSAYEAASSDRGAHEKPRQFHGILDIIYNFSSLISDATIDTKQLPAFNRRLSLVDSARSDGDPWITVQFYILQSQYLNATGDPRLAWAVAGIALRTAQGMGLDMKAQGWDKRNRKERELARKLWHCAIIVERMTSLQIGKPPQTTNPFQVPMPVHLDTDYIDTLFGREAEAGVERPSMIEFMTACTRLYTHVEDIMAIENELRIRHNGCAAKKLMCVDMQACLRIDGRLHDWASSLPSFLQQNPPGENPQDPFVLRQRNICRIRYLYVRLRLYRPFLILGLALSAECNCKPDGIVHITGKELHSPDSPLLLGLVRDSSMKCTVAATELAGMLFYHEHGLRADNAGEDATTSPTPSFWENVDYLYACGTVLLAARMCPFLSNPSTDNPLKFKHSWLKVLALLRHYDRLPPNRRTRRFAKSCRRTLIALSHAIGKSTTATDVSTTLGEDTRTRISLRTGITPQAQRARKPDASLAESPPDTISTRSHTSLGWIESLPIDLED